MCVRACVRVCVCARVCVRACVCVCVCENAGFFFTCLITQSYFRWVNGRVNGTGWSLGEINK